MQHAIQFAIDHESPWDRELTGVWGVHQQDPPPWNRLLGPVHDRGPVSGTIVVDGKTVASWGEPGRADLTFSVAKTYLALLAGVAHDRGLLPDVHEAIGKRVQGIGFDAGNNAKVTWAQMLQQTSEWTGELFGLPDQADHYRAVAFGARPAGKKGDPRPLQLPGTYWEYNDVRINQLALALLHLFGKPLPEVFLDELLRPLGGGSGFAWRGYDDAWVELPGIGRVPSVPGGSHWGGGVSIGARDQARVGQLLLNGGKAPSGHRLIDEAWLERMAAPSAVAPFYGRLLWLNRTGRAFPGASARALFMLGAGGHTVWIEPERDAVVVLRWLDPAHFAAAIERIAAALPEA